MSRIARIERTTRESSITVEIDLDGTGKTDISTRVPFFDHMLTAFGAHGGFDLTVRSVGDIEIEAHHTVEDTMIVLGQAIADALGDKAGIRRFADAWIPMDETLVQGVVDVSGRPYCVFTGEPEHMLTSVIGAGYSGGDQGPVTSYATVINQHVWESLALNARIALHVRVLYGRDPHHITEAEFKAVARALRAAVEPDPRITGIPSTKGTL
ncbi:imidazoleglycerol-phosphate dehydratase HisB [Gordonia sp. PP30]|uniref:imidazoleglycerol-phosphate dehydratase HisB n=1 Tax=Gordonia sp. PP30 TaxID=2935861 RepID=UPI001FFFAEAA|nr:imidazoleglycerol-phosphate dehydratase HisB [Gordonia sp. PP30]UQE73523.1 imidazoleglycerol-phosphate dehydratase HisB [Gordonia sp. PP30]